MGKEPDLASGHKLAEVSPVLDVSDKSVGQEALEQGEVIAPEANRRRGTSTPIAE